MLVGVTFNLSRRSLKSLTSAHRRNWAIQLDGQPSGSQLFEAMAYQYAIDAARLLDRCRSDLDDVLREEAIRGGARSKLPSSPASILPASPICSLEEVLSETDKLLLDFFLGLVEQEKSVCSSSKRIQQLCAFSSTATLSANVDLLVSILQIKKKEAMDHGDGRQNNGSKRFFCPERSAPDSLLFRLIVALQLCSIRISDAFWVVTGRRKEEKAATNPPAAYQPLAMISAAATCSLGLFAYACFQCLPFARSLDTRSVRRLTAPRLLNSAASAESPIVLNVARLGLAVVGFKVSRDVWNNIWMRNQLSKSRKVIVEWNRQWRVVQSTTSSWGDIPNAAELSPSDLLQAKQTQKLIDYTLREPPKSSLWQSQGELRFLLLKRAMDIFYASVGAAMDVTRKSGDTVATIRSEPDWQLTLAAAAASSFYSLIGASRKAAEVTSSSLTAGALIQNAWGMVSLPAVKTLSLRASRMLKGAAVAERIEICGVPCFVLSADPAPELAATVNLVSRRNRRNSIHTLSTIDESSEHAPHLERRNSISRPFAATGASGFCQRDVIFHLTGGGFFAHIIASDLPYLLDWSSATGAVVICPEYGLLPDHCFPDALNQVDEVYRSLVSGHVAPILGFEVNRIILTGESAGGNLAAALCVKLGLDGEDPSGDVVKPRRGRGENGSNGIAKHLKDAAVRIPDALMLSCPVLNLSLELSHSRVVGTNDPVLPSGLISAISDAYVPSRLGISKKHPLASPFFATDAMLSAFPPTLLIASSNDPLLDDSVAFNQRLRSLNIESQLRAAENLPHAFLGLGTAGFPEAEEAQQACQAWLGYQLSRPRG